VKGLDSSGILTIEAHVNARLRPRWKSEGSDGGGHRGPFGDSDSIPRHVNPLHPRSWTFCGWPSVNHANRRPEQSDHRNALSPFVGLSRATGSGCEQYAIRPGPHGIVKAERQADYQTKQDQGLVVGRAVVPARGMPKGMAEVCR
jgi:hypothetical protein